jgi:anaerobic dimethyl sulfoxide reductase subunit C (anchor subunit)
MQERPLIIFTVLAQMAVGAFFALVGLRSWIIWTVDRQVADWLIRFAQLGVGLALGVALLNSLGHLGNPQRAYRALANLKSSWLSREILFAGLFAAGWAAYTLLLWLSPGGYTIPRSLRWLDVGLTLPWAATAQNIAGAFAILAGLGLMHSMARVYDLPTIPSWKAAASSFWTTTALTGLLLGGLLFESVTYVDCLFSASLGLCASFYFPLEDMVLALAALLVLLLQFALMLWRRAPVVLPGVHLTAALQHPRLARGLLALRLLAALILAALLAGSLLAPGPYEFWLLLAAWLLALAAELLGRYLFYASYARYGV